MGSAFCPRFSRNIMFLENVWIRKSSEIFCFVQCMLAVFRDFLASKTDVVLDVFNISFEHISHIEHFSVIDFKQVNSSWIVKTIQLFHNQSINCPEFATKDHPISSQCFCFVPYEIIRTENIIRFLIEKKWVKYPKKLILVNSGL